MKFTNQTKEEISTALAADYATKKKTYDSQNKYATSIQINAATVSNVISRTWKQNPVLVSDKKWQEIANAINFKISEATAAAWITAETELYNHLTAILNFCKLHSETSIFCDEAGIGKTYTCDDFQKNHSHVYIVRGSNTTSKNKFIRDLAAAVGVEVKGKYDEMLEKTMRSLLSHSAHKPLLIIDEAGDLDDKTFLLIKQLYNRLKGKCGMFMTGAGGLRKKMDSGIRLDKNGFDEVADRFGFKESKHGIVPNERTEREEFFALAAEKVCIANGVTDLNKIKKIIEKEGSLRRVEKEIKKIKSARHGN